MGKIDSTIKAEIQRMAKHEVRVVFRPPQRSLGDEDQALKYTKRIWRIESAGKRDIKR